MKNSIKVITLALLVYTAVAITSATFAQGPPTPLGGSDHGEKGDIPGGGAPIGEGLLIFTLLGAAYSARKWQKSKQSE